MKIGFLLFPEVTQLDFTGPLQFLSRLPGSETVLIAKSNDPIKTDTPMRVLPTHTFDTAPKLDLLCVPGGFGTAAAIADKETLRFVREAGTDAEYVTSVCTGALVLGAAGLLEGKNATTHWAYTDLLELCGATHVDARVVRDGNTFTGGGVTAGIDFALTVASAIKGETVAQSLQLGLEYDPSPPFDMGHPSKAPEQILEALKPRYIASRETTAVAIKAARNTAL
ncbi:MAG: DJ-1/PfpI family protein [Pseudomonadota bacterium]